MAQDPGETAAYKFLELLSKDEKLRTIIDNVIDESIFSAAKALGAQQGLEFSSADLEHAIIKRLGLGEYRLSDDTRAGKCKTKSGCRSPCVYCNSNMPASSGEIGQLFCGG